MALPDDYYELWTNVDIADDTQGKYRVAKYTSLQTCRDAVFYGSYVNPEIWHITFNTFTLLGNQVLGRTVTSVSLT